MELNKVALAVKIEFKIMDLQKKLGRDLTNAERYAIIGV